SCGFRRAGGRGRLRQAAARDDPGDGTTRSERTRPGDRRPRLPHPRAAAGPRGPAGRRARRPAQVSEHRAGKRSRAGREGVTEAWGRTGQRAVGPALAAGARDRMGTRFGEAASVYDRVRPRYPQELYDWIQEARPEPGRAADVGAGTGIFGEG